MNRRPLAERLLGLTNACFPLQGSHRTNMWRHHTKVQKYKTQKEKQKRNDTITNLQKKIKIKNHCKISAPVEPSSYYVTPSCRPPSCHNFAFTLADYALSMTFTQCNSLFCQNCVYIGSLKSLAQHYCLAEKQLKYNLTYMLDLFISGMSLCLCLLSVVYIARQDIS